MPPISMKNKVNPSIKPDRPVSGSFACRKNSSSMSMDPTRELQNIKRTAFLAVLRKATLAAKQSISSFLVVRKAVCNFGVRTEGGAEKGCLFSAPWDTRASCKEVSTPICRIPIPMSMPYAARCPIKSAKPAHRVERPPQNRQMLNWAETYFP